MSIKIAIKKAVGELSERNTVHLESDNMAEEYQARVLAGKALILFL